MPATDHTVPLPDGRRLRVREDGDPSGVPLITHHGTPGSRVLEPGAVEDAAERGIRLIGYDRPGYGGSTPQAGRRVVDAAADVAAIADALGIERLLTAGGSGGGPHSLACAACLGDRVAAAASLAAIAPPDADGLDLTAGMGADNVEEFTAARAGREAISAFVERVTPGILAATPEGVLDSVGSLVSDADRAVLNGRLAEYLLESTKVGIGERRDGWVDDDLAFTQPWGFALDEISVPVTLWQGDHDRMVPASHGAWLADRIPGVDAHLSADDGHLTLATPRRVAEVHEWLLARW
jgi:pimeloyl-ACP methyl ester carboxylesterase